MRKSSPFTQSFEQLPNTLPIFPLSGAVVLPGGTLALNIFEPRYLNMLEDVMRGDRLIGMIQPQDDLTPPTLHTIGCAARVIRYGETSDGRLEILLEGLCRFIIIEEFSTMRGYRLIKPNWNNYQHDFADLTEVDPQDSQLFITTLRGYLSKNHIDIDWSKISGLPQETLVNNLAGQLALSSDDKQLLVEAYSLSDRVKCFTAILADNENDLKTRH